jgi:hypothetical protein
MKNKNKNKDFGGTVANNFVEKLQTLLNTNTTDVFPKKYSTGGQVLSTLAGLIPGIGGIASPIIGLIDQQITASKEPGQAPTPMIQNTNRYGNQMAKGGMVTKDFKQYDTGSHASGNDTNINESGVPTNNNATAAIQNKENSYSDKLGSTYVYSDTLKNPETGNKFNIDAAKLNKKFSKADISMEDKNALEHGMKRLSILNDKVRSIKDAVEMACGGTVKKMYNGGPNDPRIPDGENINWNGNPDGNLNDLYLDTELSIPPTDNLIQSQSMGDMIDPLIIPETKKMQDLTVLPANNQSTVRNLPDLNNLVTPLGKKQVMGDTAKSTLGDINFNVPAMVLKGVGLAKSAIDALTPAEKETAILPDYRKSDQQMYSTNIDYTQAKQDALGAANLAGNVNRSASGSFEQYQGRQANNYANLADSLGSISMKEALDRNQQYVQRAGYEQGKSVDTANRETQNRVNNQQNEANANFADQKFFSELTDLGTTFNKYEETKKEIANNKELQTFYVNQGLALLNSKYTNFNLAPDILERLKSNNYTIDDIVKVKIAVDNKDKK